MISGADGKACFHGLVAGDVVGVAMRVEDGGERQALRLDFFQDRVGFQAGIDDQGVSAAGPPDEIGVLVERASRRWYAGERKASRISFENVTSPASSAATK